jgi:Antirestriction protein
MTNINRKTIAVHKRVQHTADLFGLSFPIRLEPTVYHLASLLAEGYNGGYWHFYSLSNGGFYMAPKSESRFYVSCENGFGGELSPDALGIVACLYAYSNLSFGEGVFAQRCAEHYHRLREYALVHAEAGAILAAID